MARDVSPSVLLQARRLAAVVATLLACAPALAAGTEPLRLTWSAPAGCPSRAEVETATLRGIEGRAVDGDSTGALEADARVVKNEQTWTVRLRTRRGGGGPTGEREIEAGSCAAVAEATALVLALALVPLGPEPAETAAPAVTPVAPVPPVAPPDRADARSPARPRGPAGPPALALGAGLAADGATLPSAALGGGVHAAWTPGRLRIEGDGRMFASQSRTLPTSDAGARFAMTTVGLRGCWTALRGAGFDAGPCAGADVRLVTAEGFGADANHEKSAAWVTGAAGALGRLVLTPWFALRARAEVFVPFSRPRFVIENEGDVHRPPTVGLAALLGAEANFF